MTDRASFGRALLSGVLAALISCAAMLALEGALLITALGQREERSQARWDAAETLVYRRDLGAGTVLREDDVEPGIAPDVVVTASTLQPGERRKVAGKALAADVHQGDLVRTLDFGAPRRGQGGPITGTLVLASVGPGIQNLRAGDRLTLLVVRNGQAEKVAEGVRMRSVGGFAPPGPLSGPNAKALLDLPPADAEAVAKLGPGARLTALVEPRVP